MYGFVNARTVSSERKLKPFLKFITDPPHQSPAGPSVASLKADCSAKTSHVQKRGRLIWQQVFIVLRPGDDTLYEFRTDLVRYGQCSAYLLYIMSHKMSRLVNYLFFLYSTNLCHPLRSRIEKVFFVGEGREEWDWEVLGHLFAWLLCKHCFCYCHYHCAIISFTFVVNIMIYFSTITPFYHNYLVKRTHKI